MAQEPTQPMRPDPQPTSEAQDAAHLALVECAWPPQRSRRAVLEPGQALDVIATQPLVGGGPADAQRLSCDSR